MQLESERPQKESMTSDPSPIFMNYVKFTGVVSVSLAIKYYLEDYDILPNYQKRLADLQQLLLCLESSAFFQREFHSSLMIWKRGLKKNFIPLL